MYRVRLKELENRVDQALEENWKLILYNSKNKMSLVALKRLEITEPGCCPVCWLEFDEGKCRLGTIDSHVQVFCNYIGTFLYYGHAIDIQWWKE